MLLNDISELEKSESDKAADDRRSPFHIEIHRNDTGEVLVDSDTNCIIGSYDEKDGGTGIMVFIHNANKVETVATIIGADKAKKKVLLNHPVLMSLYLQYELDSLTSLLGDDDNDEDNNA